jgi:transcriptional regulator with XRE-family HTH domain
MMAPVSETLTRSLATSVHEARLAQGLSVSALAERSGVSRAMIAKVERAEAQPTAVLLGRLSAALGMTLSELVARAEHEDRRLVRAADQPRWVDPQTGYERRAVSPLSGGPLELVEIELPGGAAVSYPAETYAFIHQQIWVLHGRLIFVEGDEEHDLRAGDCLQLGPPVPCTFRNPGARPCRYLVALTRVVSTPRTSPSSSVRTRTSP